MDMGGAGVVTGVMHTLAARKAIASASANACWRNPSPERPNERTRSSHRG